MHGRRARIWLAGAGVALAVAAGALVALVPRGSTRTVALNGTAIEGAPVAPGFRLSDARGGSVDLHALRGDVVLVTFLYVHCPDVCPLIASRLNAALPRLGAQAAVVAVSVDPARDTRAAVRAYLRSRALGRRFHFGIGSRAQLASVWKDYYVGVQGSGRTLMHSSMTVLVDREGKERVRYGAEATTQQILADVRALGL